MSWYQKGKTNLDFTEARDSEWQWNQLGHMQVCTSLQTDNHASTPPFSFFTGRMPFLPPNQQRQSTKSSSTDLTPWRILRLSHQGAAGDRGRSLLSTIAWPLLRCSDPGVRHGVRGARQSHPADVVYCYTRGVVSPSSS